MRFSNYINSVNVLKAKRILEVIVGEQGVGVLPPLEKNYEPPLAFKMTSYIPTPHGLQFNVLSILFNNNRPVCVQKGISG